MIESRFNPGMLRLARDLRGITQAELADATSVTQALVSKTENGIIVNPSDEVVDSLCKTLRFPRAFFYQPERLIGLPHFHGRERSRLNARDLASITAII